MGRNLSPNFSVYVKVQTIHKVLICLALTNHNQETVYIQLQANTIAHALKFGMLVFQAVIELSAEGSSQVTHGVCPLMAPLL